MRTRSTVAPYPNVNHRQFRAALETVLTPAQMENVETAYVFSKYGHRGQFRADRKTRYFEHPKAVAWIIMNELGIIDWRLIVMALLHDIAEDSFLLTPHRLRLNFGRRSATGIALLTKNDATYYPRLLARGKWREVLVKVCDRLHNQRTMNVWPLDKQRRYVEETRRYIIPLIDRLGSVCPRRIRPQVIMLRQMIHDQCESVEVRT